jgi:hypothetical protein
MDPGITATAEERERKYGYRYEKDNTRRREEKGRRGLSTLKEVEKGKEEMKKVGGKETTGRKWKGERRRRRKEGIVKN